MRFDMSRSDSKEQRGEAVGTRGPQSISALVLWLIPLVSIFFYGFVGKDKTLNLAPLMLVGYLALAAGFVWRVLRNTGGRVVPMGLPLFLVFLVYSICLVPFSGIPYESKERVLELGLFFGAFCIWGTSLVTYRRNRWVLGVLIAFALVAAFYGLVIHFKKPDSILWLTRYTDHYDGRLASLYICPNHFAHVLQMLMPFCLVIILIQQSGLFLRVMAGYALVSFFPVLYFTESRAGFLGAVGALIVTGLLMALRKSKRLFFALVVLIPLLLSLFVVGAWRYSEVFRRRMDPVVKYLSTEKNDGFASSDDPDFRPRTWMDTIDMIKHKPWLGFGPGTYRYTYPEFRKRWKNDRVISGHPHNEYLEVASEYGLVGFGLFALAWMYGLVRILIFALKSPNKHHSLMAMAFLGTAAGTMFHSFFDFQMHVFPNTLIFALLAGMTVGQMQSQQSRRSSDKAPTRNVLKNVSAVGLAVAYLLAAVLCVQVSSSAIVRALADRQVEKGLDKEAEAEYLLATKIDPGNWWAERGLAELYFNRRYYSVDQKAKRPLAIIEEEHFKAALKLNPKDPELLHGLGKVQIFLGDLDAGLERLREATALRPFNSGYWWHLGVELRDAERYDEALEIFEYAYSLQRSQTNRRNIAWLKAQLGIAPDPFKKKPVKKKPPKRSAEMEAAVLELQQLLDGFESMSD